MIRQCVGWMVVVVGMVGCGPAVPQERYIGNHQTGTVTREGEYDLNVVGNGHTVTVAGGVVRRLNATGTGHQIRVQPGVEVKSVNLSGVNIQVHLPAGSKPEINRSGVGCEVIVEPSKEGGK